MAKKIDFESKMLPLQLGKEDMIHAIRDCQTSKEVWLAFVPPLLQQSFFSMNLPEWLMTNLNYRRSRKPWRRKVAREHGYNMLESLEVEMWGRYLRMRSHAGAQAGTD